MAEVTNTATEEVQENIILRDWLTFTSKQHDPMEIVEALGLSHVSWVQLERGLHGYKSRIQFSNINILYDGTDDMGVCCEMSGQGCRSFEEYTTLPNKWDDLLGFIFSNELHITRLDVAYDDHMGVFDLAQMEQDTRSYNFVSRFNRDPIIELQLQGEGVEPGKTFYFGSPSSKVRFRIYDKAVERGYTDGRHWVRFEIQMRDDRAENYLKLSKIDENGNEIPLTAGESFCGVVKNYLRFVIPSDTDTNKRRWEMTDYWKAFLGDAVAVSIYTCKGTDYNVQKCKENVQNRWGNAISAMFQVCGTLDAFKTMIDNRTCKPNVKYEVMLNKYYAEKLLLDKMEKIAHDRMFPDEETCYERDEIAGKRMEDEPDIYTQRNLWEACDDDDTF